MTTMMEDTRTITSIWFTDDSNFSLSQRDVDKIEPYYENGQMAAVVWFAVYGRGQILHRVNSAQIAIVNYD